MDSIEKSHKFILELGNLECQYSKFLFNNNDDGLERTVFPISIPQTPQTQVSANESFN